MLLKHPSATSLSRSKPKVSAGTQGLTDWALGLSEARLFFYPLLPAGFTLLWPSGPLAILLSHERARLVLASALGPGCAGCPGPHHHSPMPVHSACPSLLPALLSRVALSTAERTFVR